MTKEQFEDLHGVRLVCKSELWWARLISRVSPAFSEKWWTTVRFPFGRATIAYPVGVDPMAPKYWVVRAHELVHVRQQRGIGLLWSVLLYFLLPLPVLWSGRWLIEREAYLADLKMGQISVDQVVDLIWRSYGWPWPKPLMRAWFRRRIREI